MEYNISIVNPLLILPPPPISSTVLIDTGSHYGFGDQDLSSTPFMYLSIALAIHLPLKYHTFYRDVYHK